MAPAAVSLVSSEHEPFRDGLGERRLSCDPSGQPRELLCIRGELTAVPSFEFALRERVARLSEFRHPYFATVRSVERLAEPESSLGLLSDHLDGFRLSDLLARAAARGLNLDINAALCLIRQIVPAVARLHDTYRDIAHGALGPERVILTATGRLMVTEHVFGAALEQLRYSQERHWRDLRITVPRAAGLPRFDQRTDVAQIGVIALSLVLGRALRDDEFPGRIGDVLTTAQAIAPKGGFEPLPPALRGWLTRALQLDPRRSFATAAEAHDALEGALADIEYPGLPASVEAFLDRYHQAAPPPAGPTSAPDANPLDEFQPEAPISETLQASIQASIAPRQASLGSLPATATPPQVMDRRPPTASRAVDGPPLFAGVVAPTRRRWPVLVGAVAVVALAGAMTAGARPAWRRLAPVAASPPTVGTVVITTAPASAAAFLDGRSIGLTPQTLTLAPGSYSLELRHDGQSKVVPVGVTAGTRLEQYIELPAPVAEPASVDVPPGPSETTTAPASTASPAPVPAATGWIEIRTPIALAIEEGSRTVAQTTGGRFLLTAGSHDLVLHNETLDVWVTRTVDVLPGKVTPLIVDVPNGFVAVNAQPWADVWIDGRSVGETPIGNFALPVGEHDVVLRHPELGERRYPLTVSRAAVVRLSVDLRAP